MEGVNLNQANKLNPKYLSIQQNTVSNPIETTTDNKQVKDDDNKLERALVGLAALGAVITIGTLAIKGKLKPKQIKEAITDNMPAAQTEEIVDITKDGIGKLLKNDKKLSGKFSKTIKDGSNVVIEYTDGVLKKSTKTASDGTKILEKIYTKADNGDLLVNNKNITAITKEAKKHQKDFSSPLTKINVNLEEFQNFDKKNLSKKQIKEPDLKIKAKQDTIQPEGKNAGKANKRAEKEVPRAEEKVQDTIQTQKNFDKKKYQKEPEEKIFSKTNENKQKVDTKYPIETKTHEYFDPTKVKLPKKNARNLPEPDIMAFLNREWTTDDLEAFLKLHGRTLDDFDSELMKFLKEVNTNPGNKTKISFYDHIFNGIKQDKSITKDTVFYHGTTADAKKSILKDGFDLSKNIHHESGKGVYTVTYKPSPDYVYGDGSIIKMQLLDNKKIAYIPGGITSKIKDAQYAYQASFNEHIPNNKLFAQENLVQDSILRQLKKQGYAGVTTSTINAQVPYTVIWNPADLKIIG